MENKGILILGNHKSGMTSIAEAIAKTHEGKLIIRIDHRFASLPWGIDKCALIIIRDVNTAEYLNDIIFRFPARYRTKLIVVAQPPEKEIDLSKIHEKFHLIDIRK